MHWKLKAAIQNGIAILPSSLSYAAYYWMQRSFGGWRQADPTSRLNAGITTWRLLLEAGEDPVAKSFLEVGTGRVPTVPIAYWLMGAAQTITIDLNPYLKGDLTEESLRYIREHREEVEALFGDLLDRQRFDQLLAHSQPAAFSTPALLERCAISYIAPGDAAATGLPDQSIDYHTSYTVFEHIPPDILAKILREGNRIVRENGLFVHKIDYSDHFSHDDPSISTINFLQYSDARWHRYAGNRYMYMNRLRHDDYLAIYADVGHSLRLVKPQTDPRASELIATGAISLDSRFQAKSPEILAMTGAWIVSTHP